MSQIVDFANVSTAGLESSPVVDALAGLRANEARYYKNKYDHAFTVASVDEDPDTLELVTRVLKEERDTVIGSPALEVSTDGLEVSTDGEFTVSVRLRNTGERAGSEVVQLYLHDLVAQVTRPVLELVGYLRVALEPGAATRVEFSVHTDRTAFTGRDLRRIVEPGELEVLVGTSAADLPERGRVRLTGPVRVVGHDRRLTTPARVIPGTGGE